MVRPNARDVVWLGLLVSAIVLSVTRMSILAGLATVGLAVVWAAWRHRGAVPVGRLLARGFGVVATLVVASLFAFGTIVAGSAPVGMSRDPGQDVIDRFRFEARGSTVENIEVGRLVAYRSALTVISASPVIGSGLGTLIPIDYRGGGSEPETPGMQPGVDDAWLTVATKAGVIGVIVFAAMLAWPLFAGLRRTRDRLAWWFLPGWLGILGLSLTQSFATTGYGPFGLSLLLVLLALRPPPERLPAA